MGCVRSNGRRSSRSHSSSSTTAQNRVSPFHRRPRFEPLEDRRLLSIYSVNSLADLVADDGLVTLREALQAANTNAIVYDAPAGSNAETDVITFAPELFTDGVNPSPGRITLGGAHLEATDAAGVNIQGPGAALLTIDANRQSRVFYVAGGAEAGLSGMTITGGLPPLVGHIVYWEGGGIQCWGTCSADNVVIVDNSANFGGGISNYGTFSLSNSIVYGNSATEGNTGHGGGIDSYATLSVTNSTIVGNWAYRHSGGIYSPYTFSMTNSIVAGNDAPSRPDIHASLSDHGVPNLIDHCLIGIWTESFLPSPNNIWGTALDPLDPTLMTLVNNNGDILGLRPLPDSPAVNAGKDALAVDTSGNALASDILGGERIVGAAVDMGAMELQTEPQLAVSPMTPLDLTEGDTAAIQIALSAAPAGPVTVTVEKTADSSDDVFINKTTLRFNTANWNVPQTVTLLAAHDADWNDDDAAKLLVSTDAMDTVLLDVVVDDDDVQHYVVDSLADVVAADGLITLREAMQAAGTNTAVGDAPAGCPFGTDVITFAPELFTDGANPLPGTITLTGSPIKITDPAGVDIQGPGADLLAIDANGAFSAFSVSSNTNYSGRPAAATISRMTITHARGISGVGAISNGGYLTLIDMNVSSNVGWGIHNSRSLSVIDSIISGNSVGGIQIDRNATDTVIRNSTIANNSIGSYGGGIHCGIHCEDGTLWVIDSTISGNECVVTSNTSSATYSYGGGIYTTVSTYITNSTIANNVAGDGSVSNSYASGGGIYATSLMCITNSTIAGNRLNTPGDGGGVYNRSGEVLITNSTITGNAAGVSGGGVYVSGAKTTLANSIIALNTAPTDPDISGALAPVSTNNLIGVDPLFVRNPSPGADGKWGTADDDLGDLHLRAGSPAINTGSNALAIDAAGNPLTTDLDGKDRILYGTVDIGAYEFDDLWALSDTYDLANGEPAVLDILANDLYSTDPATSIEIITPPQFGAVTVNLDGTVSYTPYCAFAYTDRFQYRLVASGKTPSEATVTLNLMGTGGISVSTAVDELDTDYTPGDLSLREALFLATLDPNKNTITFDPSLSGQTVVLQQGELVIDSNVDIEGPGADQLTIDADGKSRVFSVPTGVEVGLSGMTITGGSADNGGGIYNLGMLTVRDATISGNSATDGPMGGGGICSNGGTLTVTSSMLSNNSADYYGGGVYSTSGTLTVTNSTLSGNSARGGSGGGIYSYLGTLTVTNSTLSGNSSRSSGGGIVAISNPSYKTTLTNTIVAGNVAPNRPDISVGRAPIASHNLIGDGTGQSALGQRRRWQSGGHIRFSDRSGVEPPHPTR